jgi:hypothetical protein
MAEISSVKINANGTYSNYFQISETGAKIFQGSPNPNSISVTPVAASGDLYICTSIPELFIYSNSTWVPIGQSSVSFYSENITISGIVIGSGITFSGTLYAGVNINTASTLILPSGLAAGTSIILKDESGLAGMNNITISSQDSSLIDGQASVSIDINYGCYTFMYTGTHWTIVSAMSSFPLNEIMIGGGVANNYTLPAISPYLSYVNNFQSQNYVPGNISTGQVLSVINIVDALSFPENFVGSIASCITPPQGNVVINITVNSVYIGTLSYSANNTVGYFTTSSLVTTNPGDVIIFTVAVSDSTISGISFTIIQSNCI